MEDPAPETDARPFLTGPQRPQDGIPAPPTSDRLPRRTITRPASLWWLGVHGGAGESTLERTIPGSAAAHHAWPLPPESTRPEPARVILVARTHASGLRAAQLAATEWASGSVQNVQLLGLVLVADAPGRLPRPLKDTVKIITGGVPRTWHIPWIEAWRLNEPWETSSSPKPVRGMVSDVNVLLG
ncbi:DUF6668 family protein [Nocardiopsis aegyptia]|uniref:DUF6668 family protein n=1 Tax=Nocardiopsis aegyptia TaxID=220378 RepID=UPI00366F8727